MERHKATTHNCVPLWRGYCNRLYGGFVPEHVVLFLHLFYLCNKGRPKAATHNRVPHGGVKVVTISSRTAPMVGSYLVMLCSLWRV